MTPSVGSHILTTSKRGLTATVKDADPVDPRMFLSPWKTIRPLGIPGGWKRRETIETTRSRMVPITPSALSSDPISIRSRVIYQWNCELSFHDTFILQSNRERDKGLVDFLFFMCFTKSKHEKTCENMWKHEKKTLETWIPNGISDIPFGRNEVFTKWEIWQVQNGGW